MLSILKAGTTANTKIHATRRSAGAMLSHHQQSEIIMTKLVPDHRLIAIERWKARMYTSLALGLVLCAAGWFNIAYRDNSLGWIAFGYLVIGFMLVALGYWLLHRGPRLPSPKAEEVAPESPTSRS